MGFLVLSVNYTALIIQVAQRVKLAYMIYKKRYRNKEPENDIIAKREKQIFYDSRFSDTIK